MFKFKSELKLQNTIVILTSDDDWLVIYYDFIFLSLIPNETSIFIWRRQPA